MELLLPAEIQAEIEDRVRTRVPQATLRWYAAGGVIDEPLEQVEGFFRFGVPEARTYALVAAMPALRWLHISRAGVNGRFLAAVQDRPIALTNSAGMHAVPIGEYVLWAMLSHAKRAKQLADRQRRQVWLDDEDGFPQLEELAGKTLLIIGLGRIGVGIAQRARAFGMRVIGVNRSGRARPYVDTVLTEPAWRAVLPQTDYLVLAAPLTEATRGMIGAAELAQLPRHCYLINVARGAVVDEAALIAALRSQRLAGATLDVFEQEPLPADHPLWQLPTVTVTPHLAWSSPMSHVRTLQIFFDNLTAFASGQPLPNLVDKQAGY